MKKIIWSSSVLIIITLLWIYLIPGSWQDQLNSVGYAFCHRIPSHSDHVNGHAFSFCARCYGMYFGALISFVTLNFMSNKRGTLPKWHVYIICGIFFILFALDGLNSTLITLLGTSFLYETTNLTRHITGMGIGMGMSIFLTYALNASIWKKQDQTPIINTFPEMLILLGAEIFGFSLFYINHPFILETLNILSVIGFVITLSSIVLTLIIMITKKDNSFETSVSLIPYIIISVSIAITIILSFDLARFWLTKTWEGFNFIY